MLSENLLRERLGCEYRFRVSELLDSLVRSTPAENACILHIQEPIPKNANMPSPQTAQVLFWLRENASLWPNVCEVTVNAQQDLVAVKLENTACWQGIASAVETNGAVTGRLFIAGFFPDSSILSLIHI